MRFGAYLKGLNDRCKNYATGCSGRFFAPPRLMEGMESPKNRRKMADDSCQGEVEPGGSCRHEPKRTPAGLALWEFFRGLSRETTEWLLQQFGDRRAVEPLRRLLERTQDI
jgi:hypothetical protein